MNKARKIITVVLCLLFISVFVADIVIPEQGLMISSAEAAAKVKLNKKKLTMTVGQKYQLKLNGTKEKVKWSSSDKKIATVSKKGLIKAKKAGKVKITAKVGKKTYTCKITVKAKGSGKKGLIVDKKNVTLYYGESVELTVTSDSDNAIFCNSGDRNVANATLGTPITPGIYPLKIQAAGLGSTEITLNQRIDDREYITVVPVAVVPKPLTLSAEAIDVELGETVDVTVSGNSENGYEYSYNIEIPDIVTCSWNSWSTIVSIKGEKIGETFIEVRDEISGETKVIMVNVVCTKLSIQLPPPPQTVNHYGKRNSVNYIQKTADIYDMKILSIRHYDSGYSVEIGFGGTKTYDEDGDSSNSNVGFSWKLYNSANSVVQNGDLGSPSVTVGESWALEGCKALINDLQPGTYTLKLFDFEF